MTADRHAALSKVNVGDIFHATSANGASLICLTTSVTETMIEARTVTTQMCLVFDRQTGVAAWGTLPVLCRIDSTAPLPPEIHEAMLRIDYKYRFKQSPEGFKLLDAEKQALIFVASYYPSHSL